MEKKIDPGNSVYCYRIIEVLLNKAGTVFVKLIDPQYNMHPLK